MYQEHQGLLGLWEWSVSLALLLPSCPGVVGRVVQVIYVSVAIVVACHLVVHSGRWVYI